MNAHYIFHLVLSLMALDLVLDVYLVAGTPFSTMNSMSSSFPVSGSSRFATSYTSPVSRSWSLVQFQMYAASWSLR